MAKCVTVMLLDVSPTDRCLPRVALVRRRVLWLARKRGACSAATVSPKGDKKLYRPRRMQLAATVTGRYVRRHPISTLFLQIIAEYPTYLSHF
jgi:hypothetical protein